VRELRHRLAKLGYTTEEDPPGTFGPATRAAVEAFQHHRGLRIDGVCGAQTWATLVEAGFRLGDRILKRQVPMMRGDDVAELQQRLGALGFDTGRVDGIYGPQTADAVAEFQQNAGIVPDAIVGPVTLVELLRVQARHRQAEPELVSTVRAKEALRRTPPTLLGRHIVVGETGGFTLLLTSLRRRLLPLGARITPLHHPDESVRARQANAAGADVYLGLHLMVDRRGCATAYYAGYRNESPGGRRLAALVQQAILTTLGTTDRGLRGMSVPILRETTMPAILIELGPAAELVEHHDEVAAALVSALQAWVRGDEIAIGDC